MLGGLKHKSDKSIYTNLQSNGSELNPKSRPKDMPMGRPFFEPATRDNNDIAETGFQNSLPSIADNGVISASSDTLPSSASPSQQNQPPSALTFNSSLPSPNDREDMVETRFQNTLPPSTSNNDIIPTSSATPPTALTFSPTLPTDDPSSSSSPTQQSPKSRSRFSVFSRTPKASLDNASAVHSPELQAPAPKEKKEKKKSKFFEFSLPRAASPPSEKDLEIARQMKERLGSREDAVKRGYSKGKVGWGEVYDVRAVGY